jgi:hypothetical protein
MIGLAPRLMATGAYYPCWLFRTMESRQVGQMGVHLLRSRLGAKNVALLG